MESLTLNTLPDSIFDLSLYPQIFHNQLQALTCSKNILIAYSGGLDSHVLLHVASQLPQPKNYQIRAMHVHHGLQKEADMWVSHCQKTCDDLDIPLQISHLQLKINKGESLEEIARTARYRALKESLQQDEVLLTAHHQNDQAETLLLQLFRGAGVQGLAAMPSITRFGLGQHARPLLSATRETLEEYAEGNQLSFIEDPSNQDSAFDRNFLRNEVLPQLRKRWPSIDKTISRSANIQAETKQLLDEISEQDLLSIQEKLGVTDTLPISILLNFSLVRQKLLIRYWIGVNGFNAPSEKKLKHIFSDVINANEDAQPLVEWKGVGVRRFQGKLYIMSPLQDHDAEEVIEWKTPQNPLVISSLKQSLPAMEPSQYDENLPVTIRFRQGGETIFHAKRDINISLKNFFHESGVPPWLRSRIPLIYSGETLIKVVGLE